MLEQSKDTLIAQRRKAWCFTLAHPSQEEQTKIKDLIQAENENLLKAIVGVETGSNDDFQHLQGYLCFQTSKSGWQMKRIWSERAHWEAAKGTARQNYKYCSKENNVLISKGFDNEEEKKLKQLEKEGQWAKILADAMRMTSNEFMEAHPREWILRRSAIERIILEAATRKFKKRIWDGMLSRKNIWIWGAPGIGKSRWANTVETGGEVYKKNYNKWWCGFDAMEVTKVLIEDWPPRPAGDMLVQHLKVWADRYCFIGETKGSALLIAPGRYFFIITSNYHPDDCISQEQDKLAIRRRFSIIEMTKRNAMMIKHLVLDMTILQNDQPEEEQEAEQEREWTLEEVLEAGTTAVPDREEWQREDEEEW
jgi:hypothetical protein